MHYIKLAAITDLIVGRYDISWQYRLSSTELFDWGEGGSTRIE